MKMNNESGRSMVEMLGVLAIIGVLSIGGIAGYTMAMNRYRANEVLDAASKLAIIAMTADGGVGSTATWAQSFPNVKVPCLSSASSSAAGVVDVTLEESCKEVYTVIEQLAGGRTETDCTNASEKCAIDFSGDKGARNTTSGT